MAETIRQLADKLRYWVTGIAKTLNKNKNWVTAGVAETIRQLADKLRYWVTGTARCRTRIQILERWVSG